MKQELIVTRLAHRLGLRQETVWARLGELQGRAPAAAASRSGAADAAAAGVRRPRPADRRCRRRRPPAKAGPAEARRAAAGRAAAGRPGAGADGRGRESARRAHAHRAAADARRTVRAARRRRSRPTWTPCGCGSTTGRDLCDAAARSCRTSASRCSDRSRVARAGSSKRFAELKAEAEQPAVEEQLAARHGRRPATRTAPATPGTEPTSTASAAPCFVGVQRRPTATARARAENT